MKKDKGNYVYYLCLINWHKILKKDEIKDFKEEIKKLDRSTESIQLPSEDWTKIKLEWEKGDNLKDMLSKSDLGFYHSRLIFRFKLKKAPITVTETRNVRIKLENKISEFCKNEIIKAIKKILKNAKGLLIFIYPIFELHRKEEFWDYKKKRPYSLPTTCFFAELDDIEGKDVKMRISGAKIITMDMSNWFFDKLVNIVFHEGLYRQTRDDKLNPQQSEESIYCGLENRLEDFAGTLMTIFHQYSTAEARRRIQKISVGISIFSLIIAIFSVFFAVFSLIITITPS